MMSTPVIQTFKLVDPETVAICTFKIFQDMAIQHKNVKRVRGRLYNRVHHTWIEAEAVDCEEIVLDLNLSEEPITMRRNDYYAFYGIKDIQKGDKGIFRGSFHDVGPDDVVLLRKYQRPEFVEVKEYKYLVYQRNGSTKLQIVRRRQPIL